MAMAVAATIFKVYFIPFSPSGVRDSAQVIPFCALQLQGFPLRWPAFITQVTGVPPCGSVRGVVTLPGAGSP
jgi:hypothetical protein